jgi:hypothetical protein
MRLNGRGSRVSGWSGSQASGRELDGIWIAGYLWSRRKECDDACSPKKLHQDYR